MVGARYECRRQMRDSVAHARPQALLEDRLAMAPARADVDRSRRVADPRLRRRMEVEPGDLLRGGTRDRRRVHLLRGARHAAAAAEAALRTAEQSLQATGRRAPRPGWTRTRAPPTPPRSSTRSVPTRRCSAPSTAPTTTSA